MDQSEVDLMHIPPTASIFFGSAEREMEAIIDRVAAVPDDVAPD